MGVREKINEKKSLIAILAIAVIAAAVYFVTSQGSKSTASIPHAAYFTTDEGATFFADDIDRLPPFDKSGKQCVRAHVFESNGKKFVGYIAKMTDTAKTAVEKYHADSAQPNLQERPASWADAEAANANGWLYKKPGDKEWTSGGIMYRVEVIGPNGQPADEVMP